MNESDSPQSATWATELLLVQPRCSEGVYLVYFWYKSYLDIDKDDDEAFSVMRMSVNEISSDMLITTDIAVLAEK